MVVENYKPVIPIDPAWPLVRLGDEKYFQIESGGTPSSKVSDYWDGDVNWVTLVDLPQENVVTRIVSSNRRITSKGLQNSSAKLLPRKSVLISSRATIGRIAINEVELATNQGFKNIIIKDHSQTNEVFLAYMLINFVEQMKSLGTGGTYKEISKSTLSGIEIPIPSTEIQRSIVSEIIQESKQIDTCKELITRFEAKIAERIRRVWEGS